MGKWWQKHHAFLTTVLYGRSVSTSRSGRFTFLGGRVDPRAGLDTVHKRNVPGCYRESNTVHPDRSQSLSTLTSISVYPKFSDWVRTKYTLTKKTLVEKQQKGYGGRTHYIDSQNGYTTAHTGRELYHLQFSLQAASPETFWYSASP